MKEIFLVLAIIGVCLLGMTLFKGQQADLTVKESVHPHIGWAMTTGIYLMIVHGIVITYFMGTGFAVKEATEEYEVDEEFLQRARQMKIRVFPPTVLAVLAVVFAIVSGTASFTSVESTGAVHRGIAYLALFLNGGVLYLQWISIAENGRLLEEISLKIPEEKAPGNGS